MYKVMKTFICRGCVNPVTSTGCTSVNIGVNEKQESADKFSYLGGMLCVDGDADAAVENRIRTGWNKFRQLVTLLTNKDISLTFDSEREKLHSSCVQSMLHGSENNCETRSVRNENEVALGLDDVISVLQQNRLRLVKIWTCVAKRRQYGNAITH